MNNNNIDWSEDLKVLADIKFDNNQVSIKNIRNVFYRTTRDFDVRFYDKVFNLNELQSAWYMIEDFGKLHVAHTMLSFGFQDGSYIAISAEIRRKQGKRFNPLKGLFKHFELVYVIADEADLIKVRTNFRKNPVRLFPLKLDPKTLKLIFVDMLERAQMLTKNPEFYNTVLNNCTSNPMSHIRKFTNKDIPKFDLSYFLPKHSDKVFYNAGLIDTNLTISESREYFYITKKAQNCAKEKNFSICIRAKL